MKGEIHLNEDHHFEVPLPLRWDETETLQLELLATQGNTTIFPLSLKILSATCKKAVVLSPRNGLQMRVRVHTSLFIF